MPVREVSNRGGNIIGHFPSLKLGRMVAYESLIERAYIYLLEYDQEVAWYEEQPLTIPYEWNGKELTYTPDFHVVKCGCHFLVECKPEDFVDSEENQRKFTVAQAWCAENGFTFQVVSDKELGGGYTIENIKLMLQFARHSIAPQVPCVKLKGVAFTPIFQVCGHRRAAIEMAKGHSSERDCTLARHIRRSRGELG